MRVKFLVTQKSEDVNGNGAVDLQPNTELTNDAGERVLNGASIHLNLSSKEHLDQFKVGADVLITFQFTKGDSAEADSQ